MSRARFRFATCLALAAVGCSGAIDSAARHGAAAGSAAPAANGGAANAPSDCSQVKLAPRRLWRLTPEQYDNTVHDLLGVASVAGAGFPADSVVKGFNNNANALLVTPLLADKLQAAAAELSTTADLRRFAPCVSNTRDDACLREFTARLGERSFRRPLEAGDIDRYVALAKTSSDFEAGARLVLQAMLQSPHFVYRFELGKQSADHLVPTDHFVLNDYEIASELSYLLFQSMPDDVLFEAARKSALHEVAQVRAQVERMLKSQRARPVVRAFVFEWLGLSAIATVPKDAARFPELTPELRSALIAEAERFIDHVMFEESGSIAALLTSPTTFLDARLASFYGVGLPAGAETQGSMLAAQERRGILTLGGTMLAHSRSNDSSPVHRGKLVRERFLCQTLPPPPPGVVVQPPALDPTKTARERYAAHSVNEPCASCHRLMDPIGLAFEHFDGVGRFRPTDNGHPIDVSGEILGSPSSDAKFVGTDQLIDKLQESDDTKSCYALQWYRFAYGVDDDEERCGAERFQAAVGQSDGSLAAILTLLTESEVFYARVGNAGAPALGDSTMPMQPTAAGAKAAAAADGGMTQPDPIAEIPADLELKLSVDNDFGMGYCRTYALRNRGSSALTWSIPLEVSGKLNQHWECKVSADTGRVVFSGEDYNRTLQPGSSAQFGFCAMR